MSWKELLTQTWTLSPGLLAVCLLLSGLYGYAHRKVLSYRSLYFLSGVLLLGLCLASPLQFLAQGYLFSAHMAQHMLLLLVVPPLLLLGWDEKVIASWGRRTAVPWSLPPALCWMAGVGIMVFWHIPAFFSTSPASPLVPLCGLPASTGASWMPLIQTSSLLLAGLLFAWPVLSPVKSQRLYAFGGIAYLFTACLACSLLGLSITFSNHLLYETYAIRPGYGEVDYLIRQRWNLSPLDDQRLGGLLMWVPGCALYVTGALIHFHHWFSEQEAAPHTALR